MTYDTYVFLAAMVPSLEIHWKPWMEDTLIQLQSWVNRLYACIMEVASLLETTAAVNCHAAC